MNIDKKALKGVVDEIEASRARQRGETEFQREALKAAVKKHQLDAKAIRIVLQRRAMGDTKRDEQDYYVHAYELALGGKKAALEHLKAQARVHFTPAGRLEHEARIAAEREARRERRRAEQARYAAESKRADEDDLAFPPGLKREKKPAQVTA
jgi:uncharacterized protein (UPF0335 family)